MIITGVIAPMARDELHEELKECNFLSISTNTSNRHHVKLAPILVRYFVPVRGISIKLLDFRSVVGETSEILANHIMSITKRHEIENKVAAFCGDNCNTNFRGVNRQPTTSFPGSRRVSALTKKALFAAHTSFTIPFNMQLMVCLSK